MRGRKKKPNHLRVAGGTERPDRHNPDEPELPISDPGTPEHMDADAREEWNRIVPILEAARLITEADRAALATYCQVWSAILKIQKELAAPGFTLLVEDRNGEKKQNPLLIMHRQQVQALQPLLARLGLSPMDRPRLHAAPEKPKAKGFAAL